MNLMTLVRLLVVLVLGWTAVSLGAGALGVISREPSDATYFLPRPALADAIATGKLDTQADPDYKLLDQTDGRLKDLALPREEAWSLVSVSPWRNQDGSLEAAGRWVRREADDEAFCGIGFLTLAGSTVKRLITLDALPTGKPCWIPSRPGVVLFPAGDGLLYRTNVTGAIRKSTADRPEQLKGEGSDSAVAATPLTWATEMPGEGVVNITDPAVLTEPAFGNLVFVALGIQEQRTRHRVTLPTKLWWVAVDDSGETIVNAGQLFAPNDQSASDDHIHQRLPQVTTRADGKISLLYLQRTAPSMVWELRATTFEIDRRTSLPRSVHEQEPMVLAKNLRPEPLIVSAQGDTVYAVDNTGHVVAHAIPR